MRCTRCGAAGMLGPMWRHSSFDRTRCESCGAIDAHEQDEAEPADVRCWSCGCTEPPDPLGHCPQCLALGSKPDVDDIPGHRG